MFYTLSNRKKIFLINLIRKNKKNNNWIQDYYRILRDLESNRKNSIQLTSYIDKLKLEKNLLEIELSEEAIKIEEKIQRKFLEEALPTLEKSKLNLHNILNSLNLEYLPVEIGDEFDPKIHEPTNEHQSNFVIKIFRKGLRNKVRCLKPALIELG